MSETLLHYITQYGYWAILALIFLQEVGIPNPIPNEFVLMFSGYMVFGGTLKMAWVILAAFTGDILAAFLVYELFYMFGVKLLTEKPTWLPLPWNKIETLGNSMRKKHLTGVFIGRMTPFIKGYVSVWNGIIRRDRKQYCTIVVVTGILWSSLYVVAGFALGNSVEPIYNQLCSWFS